MIAIAATEHNKIGTINHPPAFTSSSTRSTPLKTYSTREARGNLSDAIHSRKPSAHRCQNALSIAQRGAY
jgi:hypothetical protein